MSDGGPVRPLGAQLWRLGGVPRAIVARLEGARERLEQLTLGADQALAASRLLDDPTAALAAPIALDRVLGDRAAVSAGSDEPAMADARPRARTRAIERDRSTVRDGKRAAVVPGASPMRSAPLPTSPRSVRDASAGDRAPERRAVSPLSVERPAIDRVHRILAPITPAAARSWLVDRAERAGAAAILDQIVAPAATVIATRDAATASTASAPAGAAGTPARAATAVPAATMPSLIAARAPTAASLEPLAEPARATGARLADLVDRLAPGSPVRSDRAGPSRPRTLAARRSTSVSAPSGGAPAPALPATVDRAPASAAPASSAPFASPASLASPMVASRSPADGGPVSASSPSSPSAAPASAPLSPLRRFALSAEAPAPPSPGAPPSPVPAAPVDDAELADRIDRILRREARREGLELDP